MRLSNLLGTLGKCKHDEFMKLISETLDQAKHDDVCMRQLAHLLKVDSTQVVLAVSQLLLKGSRSELHLEAQQEQMSSANAQTADFRDAMRQVQSGVAQPRTELSDFDPIAAAEEKKACSDTQLRKRTLQGKISFKSKVDRPKGERQPNKDLNKSKFLRVGKKLRDCGEPSKGSRSVQYSSPDEEQVKKEQGGQGSKLKTFTTTLAQWSRSASKKGSVDNDLQHPGYDISAYYAQAMARKEQISEFYKSDDMPLNSIIVALPKSFSRVKLIWSLNPRLNSWCTTTWPTWQIS
ncbi:unnamed protein product [Heligmosomoides polygyrus]|uniref:PCI domain-containing protein n=1 Tax=Heligmosomoides polygyrus TaxID=6339 RepID=A0A183G4M6_HELPZ|nr:unnamed protein product [Heligmosomoides polygyrus]